MNDLSMDSTSMFLLIDLQAHCFESTVIFSINVSQMIPDFYLEEACTCRNVDSSNISKYRHIVFSQPG